MVVDSILRGSCPQKTLPLQHALLCVVWRQTVRYDVLCQCVAAQHVLGCVPVCGCTTRVMMCCASVWRHNTRYDVLCQCVAAQHALWYVLSQCVAAQHALWCVLCQCVAAQHALWCVVPACGGTTRVMTLRGWGGVAAIYIWPVPPSNVNSVCSACPCVEMQLSTIHATLLSVYIPFILPHVFIRSIATLRVFFPIGALSITSSFSLTSYVKPMVYNLFWFIALQKKFKYLKFTHKLE